MAYSDAFTMKLLENSTYEAIFKCNRIGYVDSVPLPQPSPNPNTVYHFQSYFTQILLIN